MKLPPGTSSSSAALARQGYALIMVMILSGASLLVLGAALNWAASSAQQSKRAIEFSNGAAASEAAVEQVVSKMSRDYFEQGEDYVGGQASKYRKQIPSSKEDAIWAGYQFSNLNDNKNRVSVNRLNGWNYRDVPGKYRGLWGYSTTYQIGCQARELSVEASRVVTTSQELSLLSIPICNYGIFYFLDLEICPSSAMVFNGPVHANGNIYLEPQSEIIFQGNVTASGAILQHGSPLDPVRRKSGKVVCQKEADGGVNTLSLPLGTNNVPDLLRELVEIPSDKESSSSALGTLRYYNRADLVVLIFNDRVEATSGLYNRFRTKVTYLESSGILRVTESMFDKRQNRYALLTEFDIAKFLEYYNSLCWTLGRRPDLVYLADLRTQDSRNFAAIRLINGQTLPYYGLTIATPNPLYVKGDYNVLAGLAGTANTSYSARAALVSDAITILSSTWDDKNDGKSLKHRSAVDVTVNAAVMSGIVPTRKGYYSGGVENFFRYLEDWSEATFTFNGSIVALFDSRIATAPWGATGDIYEPPKRRNWTYDDNLQREDRLPAGTPELRFTSRGKLDVKLTDGTNRKL
jgi:hypothetical protein